jgi:hypothetical protein
MLNAGYTFLNERLARFYGVDGVTGPQFREVNMSGTRRGGGLVAHASILTISSYATRTSPVMRGKWILENLLNTPPPPPPPSVPPLDDAKVGEDASLRQQMEAHRQNAACASCHARMDPLGFSLEHFNAIGEWRDKDGKFDIDASGTLPDGRTFDGVDGLKTILQDQPEAFTAALTGKLLTYALGRGLEPADRPVLKRIVSGVVSKQYRFQTLIQDIVESLPFQMRRAQQDGTGGMK